MLNKYPIISGLTSGILLPLLLFFLMKLIIGAAFPEFNKPEAFIGVLLPGILLIRFFFKGNYSDILAKVHFAATVFMFILFFVLKSYKPEIFSI